METEYLNLLREVLYNGTRKEDRTGTGTLSVFGRQIRCDLSKGFPAITTKKLFWKGVVAELLWFLRGDTNVAWLNIQGVTIWDEWAGPTGDLGPVYGSQWRDWGAYHGAIDRGIDQIAKVIETLKTNPDSRRMVVSAWNVADLSSMALEPCHAFFQLYVKPSGTHEKAKLSLHMYQRSADLFLGVPFNIASYALLTHMLAQVTGLAVGELIISFGDAHIYLNHLDQVNEQLSRTPSHLPTLWANPDIQNIDGFRLDDFRLDGYFPQSAIKAPIAI